MGDIRRGAFYGCTSLQEVKFRAPKSGITAGGTCLYPNVFEGCTALRRADLTGVDEIWNGVFQNCPALEEVEFVAQGNIEMAFRGRTTPSLQRLIVHTIDGAINTREDADYFFAEEYENARLIVSNSDLAAFASHPIWGKFKNIETRDNLQKAASAPIRQWHLSFSRNNSYRILGQFQSLTVTAPDGTNVDTGTQARFKVSANGIYTIDVDGYILKILFIL